jgi:hypothetical protein
MYRINVMGESGLYQQLDILMRISLRPVDGSEPDCLVGLFDMKGLSIATFTS